MSTVVQIAPGAVHVPGWLSREAQRDLVSACREWSRPPAGMRATKMPNGSQMSVQTVCLGWDWMPYRYSKTAPDGSPVKPFPEWLIEFGQRAVSVTAAGETWLDEPYVPDIALVNFYDDEAKMGLHQDKEERSLAPVVSISLGDSCRFRFGNTENRSRPWTDVLLDSGDLFVFGGESRMAYHGVPNTLPGTGPDDIGLPTGRLNLTLRVSGLT
ncbi:alpha-ketoglutarate-dependent dioxygenase AlkB family protein [Jatrophihabitans sp. DSM 45814]